MIERIQSHKVQGGIYYGSTAQYYSDERKQNVRYHIRITGLSQQRSYQAVIEINRAADDAAGLSISEKDAKADSVVWHQASDKCRGRYFRAVQTAEGALTEVHSMLTAYE